MSAAQRIVGLIRDSIVGGTYAVGAPLPTERELADAYGVSRTTVRTALGRLQAEGYVERRVGRTGGTFAARPGAQDVSATVVRAVESDAFPAEALAQARLVVEPPCARMAAELRDDALIAELGELQSIMARASSRAEFFAANARFHVAIAEASGNPILAAVIGGLVAPIEDVTNDPSLIRGEELAATIRVHELILSALADGDGALAEARMRSHLAAHAEVVGGA